MIVLKPAQFQASAIRKKLISATELLKAHFDQIDKINPQINAVIWQDRESAKKLALELDNEATKGQFRGPLHGVPVTVKESFDISGGPTTWGNPEYKDNLAKSDSDAVGRLRSAGAIVFGKTNVPLNLAEWQSFNDIYGTTNNPWDISCTPGGSSGGSAAALATGMSALEVGSDIGSSIRNPAHYCGVFGLKPTFKVVSSRGQSIREMHSEIDIQVVGPLARTVKDLKLAFETIKGLRLMETTAFQDQLPRDNRTKLKEFRIGIKLNDPESPVDYKYVVALEDFVQELANAGAEIVWDKVPNLNSERHFTIYLSLLGAATSAHFNDNECQKLSDAVTAMKNERVSRVCGTRFRGQSILHREWILLNYERNCHRIAFDSFFEEVDVLLTPATGSAAFKHNQNGPRYSRFLTINGQEYPEMAQLFWSGYSGVVGLPSLVGPLSQVADLPVGYQAIAGHGRDYTALAFAAAVERELGGYIPPPLCLG